MICADGRRDQARSSLRPRGGRGDPRRAGPDAAARAALPAEVPLADATFNVAHASLLTLGLAHADLALIARGLEDRIHQPRREPPLPALDGAGAPCPRARRARRDDLGRRPDRALLGLLRADRRARRAPARRGRRLGRRAAAQLRRAGRGRRRGSRTAGWAVGPAAACVGRGLGVGRVFTASAIASRLPFSSSGCSIPRSASGIGTQRGAYALRARRSIARTIARPASATEATAADRPGRALAQPLAGDCVERLADHVGVDEAEVGDADLRAGVRDLAAQRSSAKPRRPPWWRRSAPSAAVWTAAASEAIGSM